VQGPLYKYGITDFVFPIGKNAFFARLGISGMTGSGNFSAEYFSTPYSDVTHRAVSLVNISAFEYWDLSRPSGTATPYVTLYWADSARSQIYDHPQLRVAHYSGGSWLDTGNGGSTINADSSGYVRSSSPFTSFSPVTFGSATEANPLPVELISFKASVSDGDVIIDWATATENNNNFFTIEHKYDAGEVSVLKEVNSFGDTPYGHSYSYTHSGAEYGIHYYRLLQTDFDGQAKVISDWVSLNLMDALAPKLDVEVSPNPGTAESMKMIISGIAGNRITYRILDVYGNILVSSTKNIGNNIRSYQVPVRDWALPQGIYIIKATVGGEEIVRKFVIQ
jgi:hypothetical protein